MILSGLQKMTLLDFPGRIACTVFTGGCDFRCPFCHNSSLVESKGGFPVFPTEDFFDFLSKRAGMLDGVAITGGEPTIQAGLMPFMERIKALGLLVKLDTNGNHPDVLAEILKNGLCDYVAMDVKSSRERYGAAVGIEGFDTSKVERSVDMLISGNTDFEFRTTVVKGIHTLEDMESVGRWIAGDEKYFIQKFKSSGDILREGMDAHDDGTMEEMLKIVLPFVPKAQLRGM